MVRGGNLSLEGTVLLFVFLVFAGFADMVIRAAWPTGWRPEGRTVGRKPKQAGAGQPATMKGRGKLYY